MALQVFDLLKRWETEKVNCYLVRTIDGELFAPGYYNLSPFPNHNFYSHLSEHKTGVNRVFCPEPDRTNPVLVHGR